MIAEEVDAAGLVGGSIFGPDLPQEARLLRDGAGQVF
jgi:hypothetical protein